MREASDSSMLPMSSAAIASSSNSAMAPARCSSSSCAKTWPRRRGSSRSMMSAMSAGCMSSRVLCETLSLTFERSRSTRSM